MRSMTSNDFVRAAESVWVNHLQGSAEGDKKDFPIFFSTDFEKPLGFVTLLACSSHLKKLFIPGTFNSSKIIKSLPSQGSNYMVCDEDLYNIELPQ